MGSHSQAGPDDLAPFDHSAHIERLRRNREIAVFVGELHRADDENIVVLVRGEFRFEFKRGDIDWDLSERLSDEGAEVPVYRLVVKRGATYTRVFTRILEATAGHRHIAKVFRGEAGAAAGAEFCVCYCSPCICPARDDSFSDKYSNDYFDDRYWDAYW